MKKGLLITIIVILVAVLGIAGYVIYDKLIKKDDSTVDVYATALDNNNNVRINGYRYVMTSTKDALQALDIIDVVIEYSGDEIAKIKYYSKIETPREISESTGGGLVDTVELTKYYSDGRIASSENGYEWSGGTAAGLLASGTSIDLGIKAEWLENVKYDESETTHVMTADIKSGHGADFLGDALATAANVKIKIVLNADNSLSSSTVTYENRGVSTQISYTPLYGAQMVTLP